MSLENKYGIPEEKIQNFLENNTNFSRNVKILYIYKEAIKNGKPKMDAITEATEYSGLSDRNVRYIIKKFE